MIKARVCGRNIIASKDLDETLKNFTIDKVYGAPFNPNWVPFGDQNLLYLDVNIHTFASQTCLILHILGQ